MALTETWLGANVDNIVLGDLIPDGYDFYHVPRQHQRGGRVALIYNKSLSLNTMIIINDFMISSLPWSFYFLFSAPFWNTSPNSFLLQPPFTISAPTIILWHSYSPPSLVSLLPTPLPLFCLKLLISLFLHSHHPLFHFYFFRLLSTAFTIIII